MPSDPYLAPEPDSFALQASDFYDVAADWAWGLEEDGGVHLHYMIDAKDVLDYCFPVRSFEAFNTLDIARTQIAYEHHFRINNKKVVLLDQYLYEVESFVRGRMIQIGQSGLRGGGAEIRLRMADLKAEVDKMKAEDRERYLSLFVGLALGLYEDGAEKLERVLHDHAVIATGDIQSEGVTKRDADVISDVVDSTVPVVDTDAIAIACIKKPKHKFKSFGDELRERQRWRRDAEAIHRINLFNQRMLERRGDTDERHVFLYLSTTSKSERLFDHPDLHRWYPGREPAGARDRGYSIWRTARHLFIGAASEGGADVDDLIEMGDVLEGAEYVERSALSSSHTVVKEWASAVRRDIERYLDGKGVALQMDKYKEALDAASGTGDERVQTLTRYIERIEAESDEALHLRVQVNENLARAQSALLVRWDELFQAIDKTTRGRGHDFRAHADAVVGTLQRLPLQIRFEKAAYAAMFDRLRRAVTAVPGLDVEYASRVTAVARDYFSEDHLPGGEREIMLLTLFFALPRKDAAREAVQYAVRAHELAKRNDPTGDRTREIEYVMIWALRRAKEFAVAYESATSAIDRFPDDPRFRQGRYLVSYSWAVARRTEEDEPSDGELPMFEVLDDTRESVRLAKAKLAVTPEDRLWGETLVSCLNNTAYFEARVALAYLKAGAKGRGRTMSESSREVLIELKDRTRELEIDWDRNPGYHHTEAYVEYVEALVARTRGQRDEELRKLVVAQKRARMADEHFNPPEGSCVELVRWINTELRRLAQEG